MDDALALDLVAAAGAVASGEVSSVELTQTALEALDGPGRTLNAVACLYADEALATAERADRARASGSCLGPLHGVPIAHKDMFYRAGKPCASGSLARAGFVPSTTSFAIDCLDRAGAVDLGRLNMVEFALGLTGHNPITGHPKNPYDHLYLTGGSSSGPAASVAARLNFAALGSDTGGSIRVPAAACGLVGIKPTYGRVSRSGALPLSFTLDHIGPITRTTRDAALLLDVIAGHDADDPTSSRRPAGNYANGLTGNIEGVRIGVPRHYEGGLDPEIEALLAASLRELEGLGARLVEVDLPIFEELNALRRVIMYTEVASLHRRLIERRGTQYNPQTLARMRPGYHVDSLDYLESVSARAVRLRQFVRQLFDHADALHLPVMPSPVPKIADTDLGGRREFVELVNAFGVFVCPFNYLGLPAIAVPMGLTDNGIPNAMQLVARPFAERLLLRISDAYERATQFSSRRPPAV